MGTEINALIKSLVEVQQRREDNKIMKLSNVRVVYEGRVFYTRIEITTRAVLIEPDDHTITDLHLRSIHMEGFHEVGSKGILLKLYNSEQLVLHFRMDRQMARALKRIRELTGSKSTLESSNLEETS